MIKFMLKYKDKYRIDIYQKITKKKKKNRQNSISNK